MAVLLLDIGTRIGDVKKLRNSKARGQTRMVTRYARCAGRGSIAERNKGVSLEYLNGGGVSKRSRGRNRI
jgi:hypothetical protein